MSNNSGTGRCACGKVQYRVDGELRAVANCHCEVCRRVTGHYMAATQALVSEISFIESSTLRWWDSTPTVQYGFCEKCGSTLFWRAADKADHVSIAAGTLDQPSGLHTYEAVFTAEAGDYHALDPSLLQHPYDR